MENATGIYGGSYGMTVTSYGPSATDLSHSHPYEHDHGLSSESHIPPFITALWASPPVGSSLPIVGAVAMWSGPLDTIPRGWVLADGEHGTPDLSGLFVRGTAEEDESGAEGGETEHVHSLTTDGGGWTAWSCSSASTTTTPSTSTSPIRSAGSRR